MNLALLVLNGKRKNDVIYPANGYVFSRSYFDDEEMGSKHASVFFDSNYMCNIKSLGNDKIRIGSLEKSSVALIEGLTFNLGQTGFKVIEKPVSETHWPKEVSDYLANTQWVYQKTEFTFFLTPIRLYFDKGLQAGTFLTMSYGPRFLGFNNYDLNIDDMTWPNKTLKFYQIGESLYVENLTDQNISINNELLKTSRINDGDRITFGANSFKIEFVS